MSLNDVHPDDLSANTEYTVVYNGRTVLQKQPHSVIRYYYKFYESKTNHFIDDGLYMKPQLRRQRIGDQFVIRTNDDKQPLWHYAERCGRVPDRAAALMLAAERSSLRAFIMPNRTAKNALYHDLWQYREQYNLLQNSPQRAAFLASIIEAITG